MSFSPLSSNQVLAILPANTWTEIILPSITPNKNGIYIATTEKNKNIYLNDKKVISLQSCSFKRVEHFQALKIVAVEINGEWFRGKLISYNEFQSDDTRIELIDVGSFYQTKLQNMYDLPYYLIYDPLVLPIKFKNFIPSTNKMTVTPLLSESMLHEGVVLVDVDKTQNKKFNLDNEIKSNFTNGLSITNDKKLTNGFSITNDKNLTNGLSNTCDVNFSVLHDNDVSNGYLSKSLRRGSFYDQPKLQNVPLKNKDYCIITYFENLNKIFVGKAMKNENNLYNFCEFNILNFTTNSQDKIPKLNPVVGDTVKVFSTEYKKFFRGKILKNNNDGSYNIYYIDYGNEEKIPSNAIFELADELKKPPIAVKVGIDDLKHIQETDEIRNLFNDFAKDQIPFIIEFDETSKTCLENVKLKAVESDLYIDSYVKKCLLTKLNNKVKKQTNQNNLLSNNYNINKLKNHDKVFIKHFEDMGHVYIIKDAKLFNEMMCKIIQDRSAIKYHFKVGDIVKVNTKNSDYRAKIKKIDDNLITVMTIDIGCCKEVPSNCIYELSEELAKIPGLAIEVGIKRPIVKRSSTLDEYINQIEKIPLFVEFDENNSNGYQDIILKREDNSENIFEEFLKSIKNELVLNEISNDSDNNSIINMERKSVTNDFQIIKLENGDRCIVSYFKDFKNIYLCGAVKDNEKNSYKVHNYDIITKTLESTDCKIKTNLAIGDVVKAFSSSFDGLYRAKILNIENNIGVHVWFIDFGNTEIIPSNYIFELSDELNIKTELPVSVSIEVPPNASINDDITDLFKNLVYSCEVLSIVYNEKNINNLENVLLKELKSDCYINDKVLKLLPAEEMSIKNHEHCILTHFENFDCLYVSSKALEEENASFLKTLMESKVENLKMKIEDPTKVLEVTNNINSHPLKNGETVYLRYFHDSTSIFVSRESEEYDSAVEKTAYDTSKQKKSKIEIGDIVKVMFDGVLFRAKILKKEDKHLFRISFIDYGNEEIVLDDEIFELPDELKKIPVSIFEIGVKGSLKIEKTEIVDKYFKNLENEPLYIEFDEENPNGLKEADLKRKNNISIFDEFIDKPLNNKEEPVLKSWNETMLINLPEPESVTNIELKNGDIVFCCNFEDFNHIYLCKSSKNTIPQNNNFIIDASKIKDITIKKNPKRGEILKVKYEEKIFRAKVLDAFGKMYTVFLIDIGKNISVSADEVFEISNESKNVPGLAQKVGLKGAKDLKITKTVKDYFHNLWFNVPVPLILMCDEDNFNCFNEVNLKRLNNEHDIIDDLLNICNTLSNDNINQLKPIVQNSKSNGSSVHWRIPSGEHVEFLFGNNVENIHVRPIKLYEDYKNILNEFKNGKNDHLKTICPKTNENVAVYSMKYNGFYRAKIIGPCSDDTSMFRCSFSDYSFIDSISLKHIFELPISESVNTVPILCQRVSLAGLTKINNNNSRVISYLGQLVGNTLILEYDKKAERWYKQVILKDLKNLSINEEIQKLCQPMSQQRRLERKIVIPEKKENELVKPIHPIKSGSTVYITHFENFNSIFIRDASHEFIESFNKFNKQMIKYYKSACVDRSSNKLLNIGDKVCVISTLNPIMYCRAQIKDKINDEFRVFCIDYGNEELVCAEDIFELPKELEKPQNFVIKVQIQNISELKTENEIKLVKEYLKRKIITTNNPICIEFNELNPKGLDDVALKTEYYGSNILDEIRDILDMPPLNINLPGHCQNIKQQNSSQPVSPYSTRKALSKQVKQ